MKIVTLFLSIIIFHVAFAQQLPDSLVQKMRTVDKTPIPTGGTLSFTKFIQQKLKYPADAKARGIEGEVIVEFIVGVDGSIKHESVKTFVGLFPSCDKAAEDAIKQSKLKWSPAIDKGKAIASKFYQSVNFKIADEALKKYRLTKPVRTAIAEKEIKAKSPLWTTYVDRLMTFKQPFLKLSPGDSVHVVGWAPWSFRVKNKIGEGYVSWKAVEINSSLDSLWKVVNTTSETVSNQEVAVVRSLADSVIADAFLSVTPHRKNIYEGECVILNIEFNVNENNKAPLQFSDLGYQVSEIIPRLNPENFQWINSKVHDVTGVEKVIKGEKYTAYLIYDGGICPSRSGSINIPAVSLEMLQYQGRLRTSTTMKTFASQEVRISVKPTPVGIQVPMYNGQKMLGNYTLREEVEKLSIHANKPITYTVTISGSGNLAQFIPPAIKMANVTSKLINLVQHDTLLNNQLNSSLTLKYRLTFRKAGNYNLKDKIVFRYFDVTSSTIKRLATSTVLQVKENTNNNLAVAGVMGESPWHYFIAIDASTSMEIEDYEPNRLSAVSNAVKKFISGRKACDVAVMVFGAQAELVPTENTCYAGSDLDSIGRNIGGRGTAFAQPILLTIGSLVDTVSENRLVIIGDGDNTVGNFVPESFTQIAKNNHLKIFTIGVGHAEAVPFGRDKDGKPYMLENTFREEDFKKIAAATGGEYHWAESEKDIERILELIFK
jgi:TonB family protein